jgi:hypothetical protein
LVNLVRALTRAQGNRRQAPMQQLEQARFPRKPHMRPADKDPTRRTAGQYARATVRRLRLRTLVWLGALAVTTAVLGRTFGLHDWRFILSEVALLAAMFDVSHYILPQVDRRDRGASAEEQVGGLLDGFCGSRWLVVHDVSVGHGNIDHIVLGPPGVFTVETKSHPGPVRVSRVHGAALDQARAQRKAIERFTGVEVEPLIVYSRAWVDRPLARRKGVRLLPARMLLSFLAKSPTRLSPGEIEAAYARLTQALRDQPEQPGAVRELWQLANEPALTVLADVARRPVRSAGRARLHK